MLYLSLDSLRCTGSKMKHEYNVGCCKRAVMSVKKLQRNLLTRIEESMALFFLKPVPVKLLLLF